MRLKMINEFRIWSRNNKGNIPYIDPDDIYMNSLYSATAFIYNRDGTMHTDKSTHFDIMYHHRDYYRLHHHITRLEIEHKALVGRVGVMRIDENDPPSPPFDSYDITIASFWNGNEKIYDELLEPCLQKLLDMQLIAQNDYIATPFIGTVPITEVNTSQKQDFDEYELWLKKNLHLMPPAMKRQAMKELGLNTMGKKSPWQSEAEKEGIVQPGQKWWAMTSEEIKRAP